MERIVIVMFVIVLLTNVARSVMTLLEWSSVARNGVKTTGHLVDSRLASSASQRRGRYLPVIELTTQEGQRVVGVPRYGRTVGERVPWPPRTVEVVYDRRDPSRIVTPLNGSSGIGALWPLLAALFGALVAVWMAARAGLLPSIGVGDATDASEIGSLGWLIPLVIGVVLTGLGPTIVVRSLQQRGDEQRMLATAPRVPGVIVGVHWIPGRDGGTRVPVIAFRTLDGVDIQSHPTGGVTNRTFQPGTPVTVAYDPVDPRRIFTDANGSMGGTAWIGIVVGGIFAVVGVCILVGTALFHGVFG